MSNLSFYEQLVIAVAGGVAASSASIGTDQVAARTLKIVAAIKQQLENDSKVPLEKSSKVPQVLLEKSSISEKV